jgi:hypothetical protein
MKPRSEIISNRKRHERRIYKAPNNQAGGITDMKPCFLHDTITKKVTPYPSTESLANHLNVPKKNLEQYMRKKVVILGQFIASREDYLNEINTDLI